MGCWMQCCDSWGLRLLLLTVCLRVFLKSMATAIHYLIGFGRVDGPQSLQIFVVHWIGFDMMDAKADKAEQHKQRFRFIHLFRHVESLTWTLIRGPSKNRRVDRQVKYGPTPKLSMYKLMVCGRSTGEVFGSFPCGHEAMNIISPRRHHFGAPKCRASLKLKS